MSLFHLCFVAALTSILQTSFCRINHSQIFTSLSTGNYQEALKNADALLQEQDQDAIGHFLKGMALYALGDVEYAMTCWEASSRLDPSYDQPRIERARHFLKKGMPTHGFYELNSNVKETDVVKSIRESLAKADRLISSAETTFKNKRWKICKEHLENAIEISPYWEAGREMLIECHKHFGNIQSVISESLKMFAASGKYTPDNYFQLAKYYLAFGDTQRAMQEIKDGLTSDPEHKQCFGMFKAMKGINRVLKKSETNLSTSESIDSLTAAYEKYSKSEENPLQDFQEANLPDLFVGYLQRITTDLCKAHLGLKEVDEATSKRTIKWCTLAAKGHDKESEYMHMMAEAFMQAKEYESAVKQYNDILHSFPYDQKAQQRLQQAQESLRQSKRKDYYSVLDVSRNCTADEIKKAYKKKVLLYHPDKNQDDPDFAQKKMSAVNEAYEVLKDPQTRTQYDQGHDPNDPMAGRHGFNAGSGGQQFFFNGGNFQFDGDIFEMFNRQQQQQQRGRQHYQQQRGRGGRGQENFGNFRFDL